MTLEIPERVLIVRLGAIGDVANALIVATALKAHRPDVRIGWAVHELARPLVQDHPCIDRVHRWRREKGIAGLVSVVREIRRERYQLAIDLQRIAKSGLLAALSGAPERLGFDPRRAKELSWIWHTTTTPPGDAGAHMVTQYLEFVRALGIEDPEPIHVLPADARIEAWAEGRVEELGGNPILVNVGASKPENRWSPERFGELAVQCRERFDVPVVLSGGPEDRELFLVTARAIDGVEGVHDWIGRTTLPELISFLRRARLFVGCDTGPMHLAAAVGTPVVALFGPANPRRTGPWGPGHRVVRHVSRTMDGIAVDSVLDACSRILA
jgi:ADP-heptose:LPS heptosyltransferase